MRRGIRSGSTLAWRERATARPALGSCNRAVRGWLRACAALGLTVAFGCNIPLSSFDRSPSSRRAKSAESVDIGAARKAAAGANRSESPTRSGQGASHAPATGASPQRGPVNMIRVNGDEITVEEILAPVYDKLAEAAQAQSLAVYQRLAGRLVGEEILRQVERLLFYQEAVKSLNDNQLTRLDELADERIEEMIQERFDGVERNFDEYLRDRGLTRDQERRREKRGITVSMYMQERFTPRPNLSRRVLMKMYEEQQARNTTPERRRMRLIDLPYASELPSTAAPSAAEWARARASTSARFARVREELASGVDFGAVAKQYSRGPNASFGGKWDPISRNALKPESRYNRAVEMLFSLEPGQRSVRVETPEGLMLVQCDEVIAPRRIPFAEVQRSIRLQAMGQERARMINDHLRRLDRQANYDRDELARFGRTALAAAPKHKTQLVQGAVGPR